MNPFSDLKLFKHLDRLAAWQRGELPPPVLVELDLTNACNHACPDCTFSYLVNVGGPKDSIPFPLAVELIWQLGKFGVKAITFSGGGEPLTYGQDKVLDLMQGAKSIGLQVALITNGSLLTDPRFLDLCEWVRISLDGHDAESFARFHGWRKKNEQVPLSAVGRPRRRLRLGLLVPGRRARLAHSWWAWDGR